MDLLLQLVDEFLEVGVGNVVGRPVWDSIELDAVGELHLCFEQLTRFGSAAKTRT
jgi:hypothetical protein